MIVELFSERKVFLFTAFRWFSISVSVLSVLCLFVLCASLMSVRVFESVSVFVFDCLCRLCLNVAQ